MEFYHFALCPYRLHLVLGHYVDVGIWMSFDRDAGVPVGRPDGIDPDRLFEVGNEIAAVMVMSILAVERSLGTLQEARFDEVDHA